MSGIQTSLYLVAVALCIFCTGLTARSRGPLTYFTAFLIIQSGTFLCELLMAHPAAPLIAWRRCDVDRCSRSLLWLAFQESIAGTRPGCASCRADKYNPSAAICSRCH